ncbi:ankyrin repeat-containing domain protein [Mycena maculata]|uniref:Ankyrin repeat-containing domain protein n=1 Tax=Mycena maculata TaxID=230809 RepID=A0AAD7NS25_9AGAR|nr:ankyrin repeat-containing domain protein [Mycena maculata]
MAANIIGLVASVLQLVDTVAKARDYVHDFRNARKDQKKLLQEIRDLEPLIKELQARLESLAAESTSGIQKFVKPLIQLKETMQRLEKKLNPAGTRKVSSRLTWSLWGKEEVNKGLNTIERFKSLLDIWLGMDIWNSAQDITTTVKDAAEAQQINYSDAMATLRDAAEKQRVNHNYIAKYVRDFARNQEQYHSCAKRDEVIEWYSPLNFFLRQADIFGSRQPGTGGWLLEDPTFQRWKLDRGKTLWCCGMPGAGKTVLASIIVENLRAELESPEIGVAVIYLNHKETEIQTPSNLLAAVWRQFVFRKSLSEDIHQLYETHRERRTRPSLEDTHSILRSTVSEFSSVFIAVDALDEYPDGERNTLLRRLLSLGLTVNLLLTSRPHINIAHSIPKHSDLETLEIRAKEEDIYRHLDAQILDSVRLSNHIRNCPDLREEIEEQIVRRSDGMFLLAKFHIDSLTTKHTVRAVRNTLKNMPIDLENAYDEVVERINWQSEDDKTLAWRTISWIVNAKRALRVPELREALSVQSGDTNLDPDNLLDSDIILSSCAGLVVINAKDDTIRIIHYTVQTYLEQIQARAFPHSQSAITTTCIAFLTFEALLENMHNPNLLHQYDFLDYAVEYSLIHARGEPEIEIQQTILTFLANCSVWRELWNWGHGYEIPRSPARLWVAAFFRLGHICRHLMREDGAGIVFQQAALEGLTDVVRLLVQNGADVDAKEGEYDSALQAASVRGHEETISLLLDHGANIDARGRYGTALQVASYFGHMQSACLLIAAGANSNAPAGCYGTALQAARSRRAYDIVELLLDHGADPIAAKLSFLEASEQGDAKMAKLLIERGADMNKNYRLALRAASRAGHEGIVRLLIEHNTDSRREQYYNTALWEASLNGHEAIIRLLIEHGGGNYNLALRAASRAGHEGIVRIFIDHNTQVITKRLLEHGIEGDYGLALQEASREGNEKIIELLLRDHILYVNLQNDHYRVAQSEAETHGHRMIAELLIEHRFEVGEEYRLALQAASGAGHERIVRLLLEHKVHLPLRRCRSALREAIGRGHTDIARLLIEHGVTEYPLRARALYTYEGSHEEPNDLSFSKGEVLVIRASEQEWWLAEKADGTLGIVPSNHFKYFISSS